MARTLYRVGNHFINLRFVTNLERIVSPAVTMWFDGSPNDGEHFGVMIHFLTGQVLSLGDILLIEHGFADGEAFIASLIEALDTIDG